MLTHGGSSQQPNRDRKEADKCRDFVTK
jgi:hypothetical protein